jgi:hypothetical protein
MRDYTDAVAAVESYPDLLPVRRLSEARALSSSASISPPSLRLVKYGDKIVEIHGCAVCDDYLTWHRTDEGSLHVTENFTVVYPRDLHLPPPRDSKSLRARTRLCPWMP